MSFIKKIVGFLNPIFTKSLEASTHYIEENLRVRMTRFIERLIPDKDIAKTSILFYIISLFCIIAIIWGSLARIDIALDRKILSDIAISDSSTFEKIVKTATS